MVAGEKYLQKRYNDTEADKTLVAQKTYGMREHQKKKGER